MSTYSIILFVVLPYLIFHTPDTYITVLICDRIATHVIMLRNLSKTCHFGHSVRDIITLLCDVKGVISCTLLLCYRHLFYFIVNIKSVFICNSPRIVSCHRLLFICHFFVLHLFDLTCKVTFMYIAF